MGHRATTLFVSTAVITLLAACGGNTSSTSNDDGWEPSGPVEIVVGSAAGGGADTAARQIAEILNDEGIVDQPVSVVNNIGGGGQSAANQLIQNAGDGHYLLQVATAYITTPLQLSDAPNYEDFTNLSVMAEDPWVILVRDDSPYDSLADLENESTTFGGSQVGALDSLAAQSLREEIPTDFTYVSYDGVADVTTALLGGDVEVGGGPYSATRSLIEAEELRVLGILAPEGVDDMPDVETANEQGYDVEYAQFRAMVATPDLDEDQRGFWENAMREVSETDTWQEFLASGDQVPMSLFGEDAHNYLQERSEEARSGLDALGLLED